MPLTLIPIESTLYVKRLCREIRNTFGVCGVYWTDEWTACHRIAGVRVHSNQLQVRDTDYVWITVPSNSLNDFYDGYGRHICASRSRKSKD